MNKRGQFFLIAALVIIGILVGFSATYTSIEVPREDSFVYDLSKEINYEAGTVIDSGIFNSLNAAEKNKRLNNLTDYYSEANLGTDFVIIYGDKTGMSAIFYTTQNTGTIGVDFGSGAVSNQQTQTRKYSASFIPQAGDNSITIVLDQENKYSFNLKPGQTFFIVLKKEKQGEQFISTS